MTSSAFAVRDKGPHRYVVHAVNRIRDSGATTFTSYDVFGLYIKTAPKGYHSSPRIVADILRFLAPRIGVRGDGRVYVKVTGNRYPSVCRWRFIDTHDREEVKWKPNGPL